MPRMARVAQRWRPASSPRLEAYKCALASRESRASIDPTDPAHGQVLLGMSGAPSLVLVPGIIIPHRPRCG